jgi:peptide chain release factor subunit 1
MAVTLSSATTPDIRRIIGLDGAGLPILSLYVQIPVDPGDRDALDARVRSLLSDVRELSQDKAVDHDARMSLRGDLERIEQVFREERRLSARSVAVFSCSGRGIFEEVELPRTVRERAVVDETAFVRPALAVLDEVRRCCVVLVDSAVTQVWELYQDELREVRKVRDPSLRNPDYARWFKEHSTHNRARELEKQHFRRTVQVLDELFRATPYDVLAIGGQAHEVPGFVDFLPPRLRERVAGTFVVDRSTANRGDIKEHATAILEQYERDEERQLVARVLEKAAAGGFAAVGLKDCQWAASVAAVDLLLVQEDGPDVLEELVQTVIDEGGAIEHVVSDTELKEHLVAAELRFPLPPQP